MWLIYCITLFNAVANQATVINILRFEFGSIYLGIMEGLTGIALIYGLARGPNIAAANPNFRTHPAMKFTLWCLGIGFCCGTFGAVIHNVPLPLYLRSAREYGAWPCFIVAGYRLLPDAQAARRFARVVVFAGCITATLLVMNFSQNSEHVADSGNINFLRVTTYFDAYTGMGAIILLASALRGFPVAPLWATIPVACFCIVGQCSSLSRSGWLTMAMCLIGLLFISPASQRLLTLIKGISILPLLIIAILGAIAVAGVLTHRDFMLTVSERVASMVPGSDENGERGVKAWDTRIGSIGQELDIWMANPITGGGFSVQDAMARSGEIQDTQAYNHNGWASVLAKTGPVGFLGSMGIVASMMVIGRRIAKESNSADMFIIGAMAFIGSIYLSVGILSGMIWLTRYAMLFGTLCGMMFRCRDMMPAPHALAPQLFVNEFGETVWIDEHGLMRLSSYPAIAPDDLEGISASENYTANPRAYPDRSTETFG